MFTDTIFALSSGRLPSGVAVVRLSGPHARQCLAMMTGGLPEPRCVKLCFIRDKRGSLLDQGLVLFFPAPQSFTGEDCAELHLHGGAATVSACLAALSSMAGMRQAEPGEFTRRAFLMGKVDLTEAEGLADLLSAETEAQRVQALANAQGGQKALYEAWRRRIVHARAMIEAEIDFADEDDVPGSAAAQVWADMETLSVEILSHLARARGGEIVRTGLDVVIIGAPNAGKSSLLNAMAGRDVSIVTEEAGTTRDLVEARLDIGGFLVHLVDTAGIRDDAGRIEALGIEKARMRGEGCDLVLLVEDVTAPASAPVLPAERPALRVGLKADLAVTGAHPKYDCLVSCVTGEGLDGLRERLAGFAQSARGDIGEIIPVRQRQLDLLLSCSSHLRDALARSDLGVEIGAEELRLAGDALGRLAGRIDVEELLGVVFAQFCIGK